MIGFVCFFLTSVFLLYFILQPVQQKQKRCVMSRLRSTCSPLRTKWKNFSLEVKNTTANIGPIQTAIVLRMCHLNQV